jgi:peroxiredoxin
VDKAIDFELPDQEGQNWRLADHMTRGPVLLVFYRGDW